jgi:hypothetical protein
MLADFVRFYLGRNEHYDFIYEIYNLYKFPIHFIVATSGSTEGCTGGGDGYILKSYREGGFKVKDKERLRKLFANLKEVEQEIKSIQVHSAKKEGKISSRFYRALKTFLQKQDYDHNRFMHALRTFPLHILPLLHYNSETLIGEALRDRLFNFKLNKKIMQ